MRRPLRVLVVDDDADVRQSTTDLLTLSGDGLVKSHAVGTLAEALGEADKGKYSTVLLDLGLPDASGLCAINAFQESHPELPLVVLSGHADPELARQCIHAGAEDFIAKGGNESLLERIRSAVVRHEVRQVYKPLQNAQDCLGDTLGKMSDVAAAREELTKSGVRKVVKP